METGLHSELKRLYAEDEQVEVPLDGYRVDAIRQDTLVEVQHGSLGAIRDKIRNLLKQHNVLVVKPLVQRKKIIKYDSLEGEVMHRRWSPKTGSWLDFFEDFVYFVTVFPHPKLAVEVALVEIEELRVPRTRRRRRWRRKAGDYQVADQRLLAVKETYTLHEPQDLLQLLPHLPQTETWHTGNLAEVLGVPRWIAQRIAYCLRETGAAETVGKDRNALLYRVA